MAAPLTRLLLMAASEEVSVRVGDHNAGRLSPVMSRMLTGGGDWVFMASLVATVVYGTYFFRARPSRLRTAFKVLPVGLLELACILSGAPLPLHVGLVFSALGDGFLAGDSPRRLRLGLGCFLVTHLAYIVLFVLSPISQDGRAHGWTGEAPPMSNIAAMVVVALVATAMLGWLWPKLGTLRAAVSTYVLAIVTMVAASLTMPWGYESVVVGALLFFGSDAILAAQLFRGKLNNWLGGALVWWLYYAAQIAILHAFAGIITF